MTDSTPSSLTRPTRIQIALWVVLVASMLSVIASDWRAPAVLGVDGSHYAVLAESLIQSPVYGLISRAPGPGGATLLSSPFPWGYPLVLAPLTFWLPGRFDVLSLPSLLATLANAAMIFWGWRLLTRGSYWWGLAVCGLYCLSPLTIEHASRVFSEAVFTSFLLAGTLSIEYAVRRLPGRLPLWWQPLASALLVMMVFTRTAGWALLAGLAVYVAIRRRRAGLRQMALLAVWMAGWTMLVVWLTPVGARDLIPNRYALQWQGIVEGSNRSINDADLPYTQVLLRLAGRRLYRDIPSAIAPGLASEYTHLLLAPWGLGGWLRALGWAISLILVLGFARWLRREGASAFLLAAAPYLLLLMGWRALGPRLFYPVQPQLFYALLLGVETVVLGLGAAFGVLRRPRARSGIIAAAVVVLLGGYTAISALAPQNASYVQALESRRHWFLTNTPPTAIVMSLQPEVNYLYSQRRGLPYPRALAAFTPDRFAAYLSDADVDYLLVERQTGGWTTSEGDAEPQRTFKTDDTLDHLVALAQALQADGRLALSYEAADGFSVIYQVK